MVGLSPLQKVFFDSCSSDITTFVLKPVCRGNDKAGCGRDRPNIFSCFNPVRHKTEGVTLVYILLFEADSGSKIFYDPMKN